MCFDQWMTEVNQLAKDREWEEFKPDDRRIHKDGTLLWNGRC